MWFLVWAGFGKFSFALSKLNMSDAEDDFMCDNDEEDYDLVSDLLMSN